MTELRRVLIGLTVFVLILLGLAWLTDIRDRSLGYGDEPTAGATK